MVEAEKKHAIANLVRGVSHDVNNALGSVLPLVQQVAADIDARRLQPDVLRDDLQQIEQSIQACRRIFGGMLTLARGAIQGPAQANVRRALDNTFAILREAFERQNITVDVRLIDALPNIRVGQGDLEQVFLNLVGNAKDAMAAGGTLTVQTELIGDKLQLIIRDTGCGIPAEYMSNIEEPFFTTKPNGNGLGLSICRSIISNAGGHMTIASLTGRGTDITLLLPIVNESARRAL
jgi:two-component system NtrC family sensor kinase